jgi:hypothetical protein
VSNARTGFWSALGAVLGGAAGATAGYYAAQFRPRITYQRRRVHARGEQEIEDAMVIGGATGAVVGAFIGGTAAGEEKPPPQLPR